MDELNLPKSVMLLALDDEAGVQQGSYISMVVTGAGIAELLAQGALTTEDRPNKKMPKLVPSDNGTQIDDPFLADLMREGEGFGWDRGIDSIVSKLANRSDPLQILLDDLVSDGILERRESKILWIFRSTNYPMIDGSAEAAVKSRLEQVMFYGQSPEPKDRMLLSFLKRTGLLSVNFDKKQLKANRERIDEITGSDDIAERATFKAIDAAEAAVVAAAMIPVMVATVT